MVAAVSWFLGLVAYLRQKPKNRRVLDPLFSGSEEISS